MVFRGSALTSMVLVTARNNGMMFFLGFVSGATVLFLTSLLVDRYFPYTPFYAIQWRLP